MNAMYRREVVNRLAFIDTKLPGWVSMLSLIGLIVLWEVVCRVSSVPELYLPSPSAIVVTSWDMLVSGELLTNAQASLYRIGWGFVIGSAAGILLGLATGFFRLAEAVGNPLVHALYPIPKIALLPLIILWLGIGELSKVSIISLGVFFPVIINTYSGVKNVDPLLIKAAVAFRASRLSIIRKVILPGALPVIIAGLKLAAGTSLLLLVAAEMIAAKEGIGAMILHYGDLMLTTKLMVGVLALSLLGIAFNYLLNWLEKRLISWR
ncbi:Putative aliphatic sulfonates transport permease protein SsuC [Sporomusa ovata DSM 2662]|uniref:Alkanesulfonates transport system permease protein n=2 Tax=Sporomusa ovata TaxID=2378 RepID=A0A0U1KWU0_9FIRM|nr:putative aliphatic sulfonates transport permease protein SsuC [Sporomusa ovata DSM 2662]CQR71902.1 Alkanesulfonates transport system permease protein [Sporomusa ovata]